MMKLTFINVGYGEAVLIECPDPACQTGTFTMLVDGGSAEPEEYAGNTTGRMPTTRFLQQHGITHLDVMVCSHIHEDHLCGQLPVTEQVLPQQYWQSLSPGFWRRMAPLAIPDSAPLSMRKQGQALEDYRSLCSRLEAAGKTIRSIRQGPEILSLCRHLTAQVLAPSLVQVQQLEQLLEAVYTAPDHKTLHAALAALDRAMNNYSLMLLLEYEGVRILLPGDTNRDGYAGVTQSLKADLFKVGHHSQADGISAALFEEIGPTHVVSCASSDRRFGSANEDILKLMQEGGAQLFFSDCPDVPPYTQGLRPHTAVTFEISNGTITPRYLFCHEAERKA